MKCSSICFFINLFVCFYAKGQQFATAVSSDKPEITYDTPKRIQNTSIPFEIRFDVNRLNNATVKPMPSTYYFNSLGFFCQKELQIEKTLKFPVKFRLGSVAYTDQIEGKGKGSPLSKKWK